MGMSLIIDDRRPCLSIRGVESTLGLGFLRHLEDIVNQGKRKT